MSAFESAEVATVTRVRSLEGGAQRARRAAAPRAVMAAVQPAQRSYREPTATRSPRGARDPWLVVGVVLVALFMLGWHNNPAPAGTSVPLGLRVAQTLAASAPLLAMLAWVSAVLRTRLGGSTWGPVAVVSAAGFWVLLLVAVLVLFGASGDVCEGRSRCATGSGDRVLLAGALAVVWTGARLLEGALVRRRVGAG